jgi:hypothetical protein
MNVGVLVLSPATAHRPLPPPPPPVSVPFACNSHSRHHSKPNVISHDPDIDIALLFLVGGEKRPEMDGMDARRVDLPSLFPSCCDLSLSLFSPTVR